MAQFLSFLAVLRQEKLKIAVFLMLLVFYGALLLHEIKLPAADDLGRHIKNGERILQGDFDVLYKNVYSYTEPDHEFANHHRLFGVIVYLLDETLGFDGMVIFKTIVFLCAFSVLFVVALRKSSFWLVASLSIPTILIVMNRTDLRPEIFSYLFIAIYLYLLTDLEVNPEQRKIFWLIPLQTMWVNTHIFFIFGIGIVAMFLFEKVVHHYKDFWQQLIVRRLALLLVLLAFASVVNPHGVSGATLSFSLNIKGEGPIRITEDVSIPVFLRENHLFEDISVIVFLPAAALIMASSIVAIRQRMFFYAGISMLAAAIAYLHIRGIALFGFIFLTSASASLGSIFERLDDAGRRRVSIPANAFLRRMLVFLFLATVIVLTVFSGEINEKRYKTSGVGLATWSNGGAEFFKDHNIRGPIFNDTDVGSYLIYHLYPKERVFVDNRFGDAYSPDFFRNTYLPMIGDESVWREKLAEYGFNSIFFYQYDRIAGGRDFLMRRMQDPEWVFVHVDAYNVIFIRDIPEHRDVVERFRITKANAPERLSHLLNSESALDRAVGADVLFLLGLRQRAMDAYLDIVRQWPDRRQVWTIMGEIELMYDTRAHSERAVEYLERALSLGSESAEVYSFLGLAYLRTDRFDEGRAMLEKALAINPYRADAKDFLRQLDERLKVEGRMIKE